MRREYVSGWLAWHRALAWALIASNAAAGLWCLAAHRYRSVRGRPLVVAIVVAQLTALAQAIVGTVLMARYDLEPARLHALYGFSAVFAVGILYSYRTSTFMRGKEYLLYAGGCLFIMGLGLRDWPSTDPTSHLVGTGHADGCSPTESVRPDGRLGAYASGQASARRRSRVSTASCSDAGMSSPKRA